MSTGSKTAKGDTQEYTREARKYKGIHRTHCTEEGRQYEGIHKSTGGKTVQGDTQEYRGGKKPVQGDT